jgi:hypothetical protein
MKDAEDEAFDDLAKRQGAWGGGFQAKRQMAADKNNRKRGSIALARSLCYQINGAADDSDDMDGGGYGSVDIAKILSAEVERLREALEQLAQEPVARVTGMSFGRFIVEPLNPAMVLPVGMALYSLPQGNLYPCCALRTSDIHTCIPPEEEYD